MSCHDVAHLVVGFLGVVLEEEIQIHNGNSLKT